MAPVIRHLLLAASIGGLIGFAVSAWLHRTAPPLAGYADAVAAAEPSVVNIYSSKAVHAPANPICDVPRYRQLCDAANISRRRLQNSLGSGVIVRSDGYILTNAHVIAGADEILVAFFDGQTASATIIGIDAETDLALIRTAAKDLQPIKVGSSDNARVGDIVLAIGNPFGIGQTVSMGIISAKGRFGLSASPYEDFLQTDAAINPGNSGGALIDGRGRLLGINSLFYSRSGGSQGIGFAVPAALALSVLDEIITEGRVIRGWIGIEIGSVSSGSGALGLAIADVVPGSPAANAGVMRGDIITAINDQPAANPRTATRQIGTTAPGSDIKLSLQRNGQTLEVHATAGERPPPE